MKGVLKIKWDEELNWFISCDFLSIPTFLVFNFHFNMVDGPVDLHQEVQEVRTTGPGPNSGKGFGCLWD